MTQETVYVTNFSGRVGIIYHLEFQSSRGFKYCRRKAPPVWDPGIVLSFHSPIIWAHFWNFGTKTDTVYSTSHLNSEIFEWQKALFFISLNWVAFIHNGRFQIIDVIEGFILIESFFLNSLWFVFYRKYMFDWVWRDLKCPLSGEKSILYHCIPEINWISAFTWATDPFVALSRSVVTKTKHLKGSDFEFQIAKVPQLLRSGDFCDRYKDWLCQFFFKWPLTELRWLVL